jgi:transporter family-2 protein
MRKIIWVVIAFLAGAFLPLQGGFNALLGKEAKSPIHASMFSFIIGTILIVLLSSLPGNLFPWKA